MKPILSVDFTSSSTSSETDFTFFMFNQGALGATSLISLILDRSARVLCFNESISF